MTDGPQAVGGVLSMPINIKHNIEQFLNGKGKNKGRNPCERYASFDYCFNYFQDFRDNGLVSCLCDSKHLQVSCLQLAFYLASWGMFRGSTFLLEKSAKHFENTIALIARFNPQIWLIDVDTYTNQNIDVLLEFKEELLESLGHDHRASDVLVTKIMLGVFANTPAFDEFFRTGFGVKAFDHGALNRIADFYRQNSLEIDSCQIPVFSFNSIDSTTRKYTKAKIIDMIGFIEGQNITAEIKNKKKRQQKGV